MFNSNIKKPPIGGIKKSISGGGHSEPWAQRPPPILLLLNERMKPSPEMDRRDEMSLGRSRLLRDIVSTLRTEVIDAPIAWTIIATMTCHTPIAWTIIAMTRLGGDELHRWIAVAVVATTTTASSTGEAARATTLLLKSLNGNEPLGITELPIEDIVIVPEDILDRGVISLTTECRRNGNLRNLRFSHLPSDECRLESTNPTPLPEPDFYSSELKRNQTILQISHRHKRNPLEKNLHPP
ncbi:MAG: hypothetical protein HOE87_01370 [Candidatus Magasanikbacteria bacterium]|jgi:hypothetical protein|nr:hypothetical protein [Candidatus Magasanikbacteria bacterium]